MFKRRDKDDITRSRVQRLFQLLHQSSRKCFYDRKNGEEGKARKENEKIKHETRLNGKTNVAITFYGHLITKRNNLVIK